MLLETLLAQAGAGAKDLRRLEPPCLTGPDLAAAIRAGKADLRRRDPRGGANRPGSISCRCCWRISTLLMRQRSYFRPQMQALVGFLRDKRMKQRATELSGYDTAPSGVIRSRPDGNSV